VAASLQVRSANPPHDTSRAAASAAAPRCREEGPAMSRRPRGGRWWWVGGWRWRESNPRPLTQNQDFSGCSPLWCFSAPAITQASRCRAQPP